MTPTTFTLPFPPPLSACFNNMQGRGRVPSKRYRTWKHEASMTIMAQRVRPVEGCVAVQVDLVAPDKRRRDAGNMDKAILDSIVQNHIIEDDDNRIVKRLAFEWLEEGEPCRVTITPIVEQDDAE